MDVKVKVVCVVTGELWAQQILGTASVISAKILCRTLVEELSSVHSEGFRK